MDDLKEKYISLPESEKKKFLLEIVKVIGVSNELSVVGGTINNDQILSGEKRGGDDDLLPGCSENEPRKKQKTLDSWLIKSDSVSPKNKIDKSPYKSTELKNSSVHKNSVFENTETISEGVNSRKNVQSPNSSQNDTSGDLKKVVDKVVTEKKSGKDDECDTEASKVNVETSYNLRRKKNCFKSTDTVSSVHESKVNSKHGSNSINSKYHAKSGSRSRNNYEANSFDPVPCCSKTTEYNENILTNEVIEISKSKEKDLNQITSNLAECIEKTVCLDKDITTKPLDKKATTRTKSKKKSNENNVENLNNTVTSDGVVNQLTATNVKDVRISSVQSDYEAYCKLNAECSNIGLNIVDLINDERIQNFLGDERNFENEAIIFIGTFDSSSGEILPVVHQIKSKRQLLESLDKLQENSS